MSGTISCGVVRAKKKHWCCWCNEAIVPGEKYSRWTGLFQGDFQSNAQHLDCQKASQRCYLEWQDDGFAPEQKRGLTFAESEVKTVEKG